MGRAAWRRCLGKPKSARQGEGLPEEAAPLYPGVGAGQVTWGRAGQGRGGRPLERMAHVHRNEGGKAGGDQGTWPSS